MRAARRPFAPPLGKPLRVREAPRLANGAQQPRNRGWPAAPAHAGGGAVPKPGVQRARGLETVGWAWTSGPAGRRAARLAFHGGRRPTVDAQLNTCRSKTYIHIVHSFKRAHADHPRNLTTSSANTVFTVPSTAPATPGCPPHRAPRGVPAAGGGGGARTARSPSLHAAQRRDSGDGVMAVNER
jgi:hypothetical protein